MSDQVFQAGAGSQPSAGALLRAAREKQGLHIAALAAAIKVAPRKLDALENDRWDELPDATFTRALAQTVCRTLKVDARPVLDLLPSAGPAVLGPNGGGLNMPFRERSGRDDPGIGSAAVKPMVWAAALLMVVAVIVYLLPDSLWTRTSAAETPAAVVQGLPGAASAAEPVAAPAPTVAASEPAAADVTAVAASVPMVVLPAIQAASQGTTPLVPPFATPVPAPVTQAAPTVAAAASTAASLLQLSTRAASWVEVRDSRGQVLLSRLVQAGESVDLNGTPPLRLTVGNASGTSLLFRGQPVDLAASTSNNVARLQLP